MPVQVNHSIIFHNKSKMNAVPIVRWCICIYMLSTFVRFQLIYGLFVYIDIHIHVLDLYMQAVNYSYRQYVCISMYQL